MRYQGVANTYNPVVDLLFVWSFLQQRLQMTRKTSRKQRKAKPLKTKTDREVIQAALSATVVPKAIYSKLFVLRVLSESKLKRRRLTTSELSAISFQVKYDYILTHDVKPTQRGGDKINLVGAQNKGPGLDKKRLASNKSGLGYSPGAPDGHQEQPVSVRTKNKRRPPKVVSRSKLAKKRQMVKVTSLCPPYTNVDRNENIAITDVAKALPAREDALDVTPAPTSSITGFVSSKERELPLKVFEPPVVPDSFYAVLDYRLGQKLLADKTEVTNKLVRFNAQLGVKNLSPLELLTLDTIVLGSHELLSAVPRHNRKVIPLNNGSEFVCDAGTDYFTYRRWYMESLTLLGFQDLVPDQNGWNIPVILRKSPTSHQEVVDQFNAWFSEARREASLDDKAISVPRSPMVMVNELDLTIDLFSCAGSATIVANDGDISKSYLPDLISRIGKLDSSFIRTSDLVSYLTSAVPVQHRQRLVHHFSLYCGFRSDAIDTLFVNGDSLGAKWPTIYRR